MKKNFPLSVFLTVVGLSVTILVSGFLTSIYFSKTVERGVPDKPKYEMRGGNFVAPNSDQIAWFNDNVYDVLLASANDYPVEEIRQLIREAFADEGKTYRILLNTEKGYSDATAVTSYHDTGPEVSIMFYLPAMVDLREYYVHSDDYEDILVAIFLHEYRHTQQDWGDFDRKPAPDWVQYGRESDAQWYVAERVLLPMRNNERLNPEILRVENGMLDAYIAADGVQSDPQWQESVSKYSRQPGD